MTSSDTTVLLQQLVDNNFKYILWEFRLILCDVLGLVCQRIWVLENQLKETGH